MPPTSPHLPLSGIRVVWCDGASAVEIQGDMSDVNVEPTVSTYAVESGSAVDNHPVAVGYQVSCREGYTSDLLIALDAGSEAGTLVVCDVTSGINWIIPAHVADDLTEGARASITPGQLILSALRFRQRRGQAAYAGHTAKPLTNPVDSGAPPAGSRVYAAVTAAGTIAGNQLAAGFHDLGAGRVQGATTARGYLLVASLVEVQA